MKSKEFYEKLQKTLEETTSFPTEYLFKFIVPTQGNGVKEVADQFDNLGAVIKTNTSKKGTYTSVSIQVKIQSASQVITKYQEVSKIEGIISL